MKTSMKGRQFIQRFEACKLLAYLCPANVWTCGWGHTGPDVFKGKRITQLTADSLFEQDLEKFESGVNHLVRVPLTQGQFDALVSFSYNCGLGNLSSSTLLKMLNAGQYDQAADQFRRWNQSNGKVLAGLTIRREQERATFLGLPE
jgi:lysozyme